MSANPSCDMPPPDMPARGEILGTVEELRRGIDHCRRLLGSESDGEDAACASARSHCEHQVRLRETLLYTIAVLEGTRKSFKSRELAELRHRLISVLAEKA